jgi:hypothetical protein
VLVQAVAEVPSSTADDERMGLVLRENGLLVVQNVQLEREIARLQGDSEAHLAKSLHMTEECAMLASRLRAKEAECQDAAERCASPQRHACQPVWCPCCLVCLMPWPGLVGLVPRCVVYAEPSRARCWWIARNLFGEE